MRKSLVLAAMLSVVLSSSTEVLAAKTCNGPAYKCHPSTVNINSDQGILDWLVVLNKNEIGVSRVAMKKQVPAAVKDYARWLNMQHNNNLQQTYILSHQLREKPMMSPQAMAMKKDGEKGLAQLSQLNGPSFSKTFINAMIAGHKEALGEINKLMARTHNPMIRHQLMITHRMVYGHLVRAKQIKHMLNL